MAFHFLIRKTTQKKKTEKKRSLRQRTFSKIHPLFTACVAIMQVNILSCSAVPPARSQHFSIACLTIVFSFSFSLSLSSPFDALFFLLLLLLLFSVLSAFRKRVLTHVHTRTLPLTINKLRWNVACYSSCFENETRVFSRFSIASVNNYFAALRFFLQSVFFACHPCFFHKCQP